MKKEKLTEEAEAKAEMIYWATGRTKIYPERNLAKNYAEIKARSEKKRETNFKDKTYKCCTKRIARVTIRRRHTIMISA